jgi:hypothetical protein
VGSNATNLTRSKSIERGRSFIPESWLRKSSYPAPTRRSQARQPNPAPPVDATRPSCPQLNFRDSQPCAVTRSLNRDAAPASQPQREAQRAGDSHREHVCARRARLARFSQHGCAGSGRNPIPPAPQRTRALAAVMWQHPIRAPQREGDPPHRSEANPQNATSRSGHRPTRCIYRMDLHVSHGACLEIRSRSWAATSGKRCSGSNTKFSLGQLH